MTVKRYTIAEKIKMCETAIFAEKEGTSIAKTAKELGVSDGSLYTWVGKYRTGKLTGESEVAKKEDISPGLMSELSKNFNGISDSKQVKYIVFAGDLQDKNFLSVSIEEPEISDPVEKELETMKRILAEVEWFPVFKGFKFPKGGTKDEDS